jgi:ERCC4-type nuclease
VTAADIKAHVGALLAPETADPRTTFVLVTDSREKPIARYSFGTVPTVVRALKTGDYSYVGGEGICAGERKAVNDLVSCLTSDNARHQEQLRRLADLEFGFVVVESTLADIAAHRYFAPKVEPSRVLDTMATLHLKFRVPYLLCGNGAQSAGWMFRLLHSHWRKSREVAA